MIYAKHMRNKGWNIRSPLLEWEYATFYDSITVYFGTFTSCIGLVVHYSDRILALHLTLAVVAGFIDLDSMKETIRFILDTQEIEKNEIKETLIFGCSGFWDDNFLAAISKLCPNTTILAHSEGTFCVKRDDKEFKVLSY